MWSNTMISGSHALTVGDAGDVSHACLHQENSFDADGDKNSEKYQARVAVVSDRKSIEQLFSKDESIWL